MTPAIFQENNNPRSRSELPLTHPHPLSHHPYHHHSGIESRLGRQEAQLALDNETPIHNELRSCPPLHARN